MGGVIMVIIGLAIGNFTFAYFTDLTYSEAFGRSWFQMMAIVIYYFACVWRN